MIGTENYGIDVDEIDEGRQDEVAAEMLARDTVVALAADLKSCESFYLIKITEEERAQTEDVEDSFGQVIKKGMKHLEGVFLERKFDSQYLRNQSLYFPLQKVWCSISAAWAENGTFWTY